MKVVCPASPCAVRLPEPLMAQHVNDWHPKVAEMLDIDTPDRCPACGDPIDYCQGHGRIGDPAGARVLEQHDNGDHAACHPDGCDYRVAPETESELRLAYGDR